jgi:peptidyl-prolyl cis-trans isomerase SurA
MNLKKTLLIIIFLILNYEMSVQAQENKILFKVNEEIITTLDIFNEIRYLESINEEFKKTNKNQAFEISKNSLIREKIKEIKLKELLDEVKIEDKIINNILINYFERLGIISIKNFNQYFTEKKLDPNDIKKKITIEILWNQLIYQKYIQSIKIDKKKIKNELLKKDLIQEFNLSEILFTLDKKENLNEKYDLIKKTINKKNFSQAALLYSISDSSKNGGELGWIKESSISLKIKQNINKINIGQHTDPIVVPGGFLILYVKDNRIVKRNSDLEKEIELAYKKKVNEQLNQYSNIYFNKVKKDILIDEI